MLDYEHRNGETVVLTIFDRRLTIPGETTSGRRKNLGDGIDLIHKSDGHPMTFYTIAPTAKML